ncbi:MAG: ParB/RepB/Spo0J family partition protein [Oscillospiraceae bacterium]|nr:ParB/RepB/Spo0J family partition protein [Oscillospiraceae bacterium]
MKNVKEMSAEKVDTKVQKPKLLNIKLEKLRPFQNHPYKVLDDDSMKELIESIAENGLLNRIIVRPLENTTDEYEIISGHRRVHAAELLNIKEVPAVVYFIDRDEATVLMVDSNCQRESLTLMEKAKSYRMKSDALSHQGKTLGQNVPKSDDNRTNAKIGEKSGDSYKTVQRYIRLTYLTPELQEYVDKGQMKLLPAVEISYLDEECQRDIVDRILETESFPSHAQARRMKAIFEEGKLDYEIVTEIMSELKPNQVENFKMPMEDLRKYLPYPMTPEETRKYMLDLAKKEHNRIQNRDAR